MFKKSFLVLIITLLSAVVMANQSSYDGDYYNNIDPESPYFVEDLHELIVDHTILSYDYFDENYVRDFASWDIGNNQRAVTCVYSGEEYDYTPPFHWVQVGTFSREHTWCQSWMPDKTEDYGAFSDYHHLYPTNQNKANLRRSNNPLGNVETVTYQYLEGKLGNDVNGKTVYQPRDSHKGDAARALFYMAVCYNGKDDLDWSFNYLRENVIDARHQSTETLLQWAQMDPPDDWERASNEYIYSIQHNRNPFVDHPEWVNLIDFNDLSYNEGGTEELAAEPENHLTNFTSTDILETSVFLNWTDAEAGTQAPSGYLLMIKKNNNFYPMDGYRIDDDFDFSDGDGVINIPYDEENDYPVNDLIPGTNYYIKIYSYNDIDGAINYKTDGAIPSLTIKTEGSVAGGTGTEDDPFSCAKAISENSGDDKWVEGYIIGTITSSSSEDLESPWTKSTNLALADNPNETDPANILAIQLPSGSLRDDLNLVDNIDNYQKGVLLKGDLEAYYTPRSGLKNVDSYKWNPIASVVENQLHKNFTLYQNYPNPFNPATTIKFYNNKTGNVKLTVFNIKGEEVAELINNNIKKGFNSVQFDATSFNSGVYYYTLTTGTKSVTKKMLLVK